MKQMIIRNIPDDLHKDFRIYCFEQETSMNKLIIKMIANVVGHELAGPVQPAKTKKKTRKGS